MPAASPTGESHQQEHEPGQNAEVESGDGQQMRQADAAKGLTQTGQIGTALTQQQRRQQGVALGALRVGQIGKEPTTGAAP